MWRLSVFQSSGPNVLAITLRGGLPQDTLDLCRLR